jgi:S-adenosylmethionine-diacylglycerol 3-amino-3-carboxypropyl transferase
VIALLDGLNRKLFSWLLRHKLIYNTCWEDPALDRVAMEIGPNDLILVITSAGCNALDYLLAGAAQVDAVDINPCQTALLEFKVAALKALDYSSFFELFGKGCSRSARTMYRDSIRKQLGSSSRRYWDRHIEYFEGHGRGGSFYYRGAFGLIAWLQLRHAQVFRSLGRPLERLLASSTLDEQRAVYETELRPHLFTPLVDWFVSQEASLALMGIPRLQRQLMTQYPGGIPQFTRDILDTVFRHIPLTHNYFWRVYLQGFYTPDCCPEYLKPEQFPRLRQLVAQRLRFSTCSLTDFLRTTQTTYTRFVLLDHMDWMSSYAPQALAEEWSLLLARAQPGAKAIFRSAGLHVTYLDPLEVHYRGRTLPLGDLLHYNDTLAAELHARDRVHMYGSFHIANLPG